MLRQTSTAVVFVAIVSMCALQGCSSGSNTQAGSGSSLSDSGSPTASSGSPTANSAGTPSTSAAATQAPTPSTSYSKPVAIPTNTTGSSGSGSGASSGSFTAPAVTSAVKGWGTYQKIGTSLVHVEVCAQKTGSVNAVGVEAVAYNSDYSLSGKIASVILPSTPGQKGCTQTTLFYSAHLKVYSFIGGANGTITAQSAMKSIY
jgi:hypothetical protein